MNFLTNGQTRKNCRFNCILMLKKKQKAAHDSQKAPVTSKQSNAQSSGSESTSILSKPTAFTAASVSSGPKWTCGTCLVQNSDDKSQCACCMTARVTQPPPPPPPPQSAQSQPPVTSLAAKWTCSTCLVQNAADKNECACCMTPKPGAAVTSTATSTTASTTKWKCETCLVENNPEKGECVCCSTARPGGAAKNDQVDSKTKFSALVAAAATLNPAAPVNKSISFGSTASTTGNINTNKTNSSVF